MPVLATAAIVGGVGSLISGGLKLWGAKKQRDAAKKIGDDLATYNNQYEQAGSRYTQSLMDLAERMGDAPKLEIDGSAMNEMASRARNARATAGGRVAGEEAFRDAARQTTADSVARARNVGGSTADLLSFTAAAANDETGRMRQIDAESAQRRERNIIAAEDRLNRALSRQVSFNQWRDQALFQDESSRFNQRLQMDQAAIEAQYGVAGNNRMAKMGELAQQGAVADANAAMWGAAGDMVYGATSGVSNYLTAMGNASALGGPSGKAKIPLIERQAMGAAPMGMGSPSVPAGTPPPARQSRYGWSRRSDMSQQPPIPNPFG